MSSKHRMSQELYDETVLENEEAFDLSPEDAVKETLSQLKSQGISISHLIRSHPKAEKQKEGCRGLREKLMESLKLLDGCVREKDGSIVVVDDGRRMEEAMQVVRSCSSMNDGAIQTGSGCDILPFLVTVEQSESLYTLMSFLGVVNFDDGDVVEEEAELREKLLLETCKTLCALLQPSSADHMEIKQVRNQLRDQFAAQPRLIQLLSFYSQNQNSSSRSLLLLQLLKLATATCRASEPNKVAFVRADGRNGGIMASMNSIHSTLSNNNANNHYHNTTLNLLMESCRLITVLCRSDDFRLPSSHQQNGAPAPPAISSAHEHALEFHHQGVVSTLQQIMDLLSPHSGQEAQQNKQQLRLMAIALDCMRALAVNDDIVQALVAVGTLRFVQDALSSSLQQHSPEHQTKNDDNDETKISLLLATSALGLIRNLCGNDEIKTTLCLGSSSSPSVLPNIMQSMKQFITSAKIQEHGCGTMAAMALRRPDNALRIVTSTAITTATTKDDDSSLEDNSSRTNHDNGIRRILTAMKRHDNVIPVQRQGCLAIRNIVSRLSCSSQQDDSNDSPNNNNHDFDIRTYVLDMGAEAVLRLAGRHQGSVDEAYAALRDLNCSVSMIKFNINNDANNGETVTTTTTEMFGQTKTNFRPVYETSG